MEAKGIMAAVLALVLIVAAFYIGGSGKITKNAAQAMVSEAQAAEQEANAKALAASSAANQAAMEKAVADAKAASDAAAAADKVAMQKQVDDLNAKIDAMVAEEVTQGGTAAGGEEPTAAEMCDYTQDELGINVVVDAKTLSDRELECALFDGTVEWDGDEYEAEETLATEDLFLLTNEADYGADVFMQIPEDGVLYTFAVEGDLPTEDITMDEPLQFNLLGEKVKVTDWQADEVTFFSGNKQRVKEGESITFEDKVINIAIITEDSIFVEVGDDSAEISEGNSHKVGGVDIMVDTVLENEAGETVPDMAILYIGTKDVEHTVVDGDEYEEDSAWEWVITDHSIGLRLAEGLMDVEDDDFAALADGEKLCLPDFLCIKWDGLVDEDVETLDLSISGGVLRVAGDLRFGINDYKKVYADSTGFYEDDELTEFIGMSVEIGDTDLSLDIDGSWVVIETDEGDLELKMDLTEVNADGNLAISPDEDYRMNYGIIVKDVENSLEDQDFTILVPDEQLMGTMTTSLVAPVPEPVTP